MLVLCCKYNRANCKTIIFGMRKGTKMATDGTLGRMIYCFRFKPT